MEDQLQEITNPTGDLEPDYFFEIPEQVRFREIDGEAILLNLDSGVYFGLDEVGTRVWNLISEKHTLGDIQGKMIQEFDVSQSRLSKDLNLLIRELLSRGLLLRVIGTQS